jgi:protein-disulfide isomerase
MTGIDDYDTQYATVLDDVRKDSQLGKKLGVSGTPTFFLNGIKMPSVRVSHLEDAITYELGKAGVSTQ